jgi:hypothetical protein
MDFDPVCVLICKVNGYPFYMSWLIKPVLEPLRAVIEIEPKTALKVVESKPVKRAPGRLSDRPIT